MSETTPSKATAKTPKWVHYFVDYAGLVVFVATWAITRNVVTASWAIIVGSVLALGVGLFWERRLAHMPLVTAVLGLIFGGLTVFFHDERFIKVKPTILYTAFGLFLITGAIRGKNPLKVLMGDAFHLPDPVVRALTLRYALFFFALAAANEAIWRTQSTAFWVFFKLPGVPILIFLFAMSQAPLMLRHMPDDDADEEPEIAPPPTDRL